MIWVFFLVESSCLDSFFSSIFLGFFSPISVLFRMELQLQVMVIPIVKSIVETRMENMVRRVVSILCFIINFYALLLLLKLARQMKFTFVCKYEKSMNISMVSVNNLSCINL